MVGPWPCGYPICIFVQLADGMMQRNFCVKYYVLKPGADSPVLRLPSLQGSARVRPHYSDLQPAGILLSKHQQELVDYLVKTVTIFEIA